MDNADADAEMPRSVLWFVVSALVGSMTIRALDYWRLRIERDFRSSNQEEGAQVSYPFLAENPIWIGVLIGIVVFVVGLYLIRGYAQTAYLRPEPPAPAST